MYSHLLLPLLDRAFDVHLAFGLGLALHLHVHLLPIHLDAANYQTKIIGSNIPGPRDGW